jgi:hypothetical protein
VKVEIIVWSFKFGVCSYLKLNIYGFHPLLVNIGFIDFN